MKPAVTVTVTDEWSPLHLGRADNQSRGEAWGVESRFERGVGERNGVWNRGQLLVCLGDHAGCGNRREFVRFSGQVIHIEEVVYSSYYVERKALQDP